MKTNPNNRSAAHVSSDEDSSSSLLEDIGRALACSIRLNRDILRSRGEEEALEILIGVYSFFALAQAEEQPHEMGLIDALGELHEVVFKLRELYPALRSRVIRSVDANGAVRYEPCPF